MIKALCSKFLKYNYAVSLCILIYSLVIFQSLWEFSLNFSCKYNNRYIYTHTYIYKRYSYAYVLEVVMLSLQTQYGDYCKNITRYGEKIGIAIKINEEEETSLQFYYRRVLISRSDTLGRSRKKFVQSTYCFKIEVPYKFKILLCTQC